MIKILFLIHDLGQGGAEKVLVNLVNNMDRTKFDITVMSLFGGGVNEQFLNPEVRYITVFKKMIPGNSKLMKLFTPKQLHKWFIKEKYDIEISYLEGPTARIISGCEKANTKLVSWIHVEQHTKETVANSFRSFSEAEDCYRKFHYTICVSEDVKEDFTNLVQLINPCTVLYNIVESDRILELSSENVSEFDDDSEKKIIAVGTLKKSKGYLRLLEIMASLRRDEYSAHLYILGTGPQREEIEKYITENDLKDVVTLLGYSTNPYKYVAKADIFVCASYAEGFSTATTEALIVGTPVCTVNVSGMKEMLGTGNDYGIVTENNSTEELEKAIRELLDNPDKLEHYRNQAANRGKMFETKSTVEKTEDFLMEAVRKNV